MVVGGIVVAMVVSSWPCPECAKAADAIDSEIRREAISTEMLFFTRHAP
jgi:hypothetical protein